MQDAKTILGELGEKFEALRDAIEANADVRYEGPSRVVSRSARTVVPGMSVEFPNVGWREVGGWSQANGRVLLSDGGVVFWTCRPRQRVRTRIYNGA